MITDKQIQLINNIYSKNYKQSMPFAEFLLNKTGKQSIEALTHQDVSVIVESMPITLEQKRFLLDTIQLTGHVIEDIVVTKGQYNKILNDIKKKYSETIYIPARINFEKYYRYNYIKKTDDYVVGKQYHLKKNTTLKVLSFFNLMVIDWDGMTLEEIREIVSKTSHSFMIYKTYNGYHGYCISKQLPHNDIHSLQEMYKLKCDDMYISFCYYTGYIIRLEPKPGRDEPFVEKYVETIVNDLPLQKLKDLVKFKDTKLNC